jgi:hypothetical protein
MCVYVYVCSWVYVCVYMYVYMDVNWWVEFTSVTANKCLCVYVHLHVCVYARTDAFMFKHSQDGTSHGRVRVWWCIWVCDTSSAKVSAELITTLTSQVSNWGRHNGSVCLWSSDIRCIYMHVHIHTYTYTHLFIFRTQALYSRERVRRHVEDAHEGSARFWSM